MDGTFKAVHKKDARLLEQPDAQKMPEKSTKPGTNSIYQILTAVKRRLRFSSMAVLAFIDQVCAVIMWLFIFPLIGAVIEGMQPVWFVAVLIVSMLIVGWLMARLARWTWEQAEKEKKQ